MWYKYYLITLFFGITFFKAIAADLEEALPSDTAEYFPSQRFEGGAIAFFEFLEYNLYYPPAAVQRGVVGTAIVALTVSPEGKIDRIDMVQSLHKSIDTQIINALKDTKRMWLPAKKVSGAKPFTLFLPITYVINNHQFLQNFEKPYYLGRAAILIAENPDIQLKDDAYYASQSNQYYQNKQYKQAIEYLDELIRRNPFNKDLYLMRGNAYYQLGKKDKACEDFSKITHFLRQTPPAVVESLCSSS